jgi:hypothetical protein
LIGSLQPAYWLLTKGDLIYDSYQNENFKLLDPYLIEYLFSYKKGWLLYTPIMIIGLLSFIPGVRKNKQVVLPILIFTILNIWILSSWDCWWYANSFSQRSIVQSYPVFVLPFGYFINWLTSSKLLVKFSCLALITVLIAFNLLQTYQFHHSILHSSRMTKKYYWHSFFETDWNKVDRSLLEYDRSNLPPADMSNLKRDILYFDDYSKQNDTVRQNTELLPPQNYSRKKVRVAFTTFCDTAYCHIKANARIKSEEPNIQKTLGVSFCMIDNYSGELYGCSFKSIDSSKNYEVNTWSLLNFNFTTPYLRSENDSIEIYYYNLGNKNVEVAEFFIESFGPRVINNEESTSYENNYDSISSACWTEAIKLNPNLHYEELNSSILYSSTFIKNYESFAGKTYVFYEVSYKMDSCDNNAFAVISISQNDQLLHYRSLPLTKVFNVWKREEFIFEIPNLIQDNPSIKLYLWNKNLCNLKIKRQLIKFKSIGI